MHELLLILSLEYGNWIRERGKYLRTESIKAFSDELVLFSNPFQRGAGFEPAEAFAKGS
jgi:hypothetical protein